MELDEITYLGFLKFELIIIAFILMMIIHFYIALRANKSEEFVGLSLDELIEESKKNLKVDTLTDTEMQHLKSLGNQKQQGKIQKTVEKLLRENAIIGLGLLIPGLIIVLIIIEYGKYYNFDFKQRENYIGCIISILVFCVSAPIAMNFFKNRKKVPSYRFQTKDVFLIYSIPFLSGYMVYLFIIGHFNV